MAKQKKETVEQVSSWGENFKIVSEKISKNKRKNRIVPEPYVPKIPKATIFMDGKKIILNA